MRHPLPTREVQAILGSNNGFLRLYGQDDFVYISDAPRRAASETIRDMQKTMREQGFVSHIDESNLLLIDLEPIRWRMLLEVFPRFGVEPFPQDDRWLEVYALARLLARHPSPIDRQPMEPVRAVLKRYDRKNSLPALMPQLISQCAERLRRKLPLPSVLADVLYTWLKEQKEEELA